MNCETRAREGSSLVHIRPPGTNDVCGTWVLCDQDGVRLAGHIEPLHRSSADKLFSAAEKTKEPAFDSSNNWEQLRHALQDQGSPIVVDITVGTAMQSWMIATWPHSESLYLCLPCSRSDADTTFNAAAMSLLGRQTAQVVHELNNTLDGILRYVNLSLRAAESDAPPSVAQYLQESRAGLHRMVDIISDLLAFSRRSQDQSPPEQVNAIVDNALRSLAEVAAKRGVAISCDYQTSAMPIVQSLRLYQICINLFRNALDSMPDGGKLSVTTAVADGDLVIEVADTGHGLPQDPEQVFEPYFTSKLERGGTGLGLSLCREVIHEWSGTLTATANPYLGPQESGSLFVVRVPLVAIEVTETGKASSGIPATTSDLRSSGLGVAR